jgi:hypothetical protein
MKKESAPNRIESISKIYEYGVENLQGHEYLDRFEGLSLKQEARLDGLIGKLSELYSKRNGQWLSNFLKEEESNEWNRDYETGNFTYIADLRKTEAHNVHDFARWYDYALQRYSREYFLPAANRHDEAYIESIQGLIRDDVLPESTAKKMSTFDEHKINYRVVDVFREREYAGCCTSLDVYSEFHDDDENFRPEITYAMDIGFGPILSQDDDISKLENGTFKHVLDHEKTHIITRNIFESDFKSERKADIFEANRIINEASVEWLALLMNGKATLKQACASETFNVEFNADAPYSLERKTLDALLQGGDVSISPTTIFSLCGSEEIVEVRAKVFNEFQKAYLEILTKLDLVDLILERFNWIEYQEKLKKEAE